MFQPTKISAGLQLAFGAAALLALPALAQTTTPAPDTPPGVQRVTVTGSMIPRSSAETAEAITVISADSLKQQGITTVEQALQQISSNQSTTVTASTVSSWGTGGGSFANLRGLGQSRTLVLLDGQRLAGNAQVGGPVDLNSIPFAVIDRIEVLREGASSVYGADAIAGVINFITKKDMSGGQLNVNGQKSQHNGGDTYGGDISYGLGNLATDGYNLMGSLSYNKQNELRAGQRTFAQRGGSDNFYFTAPGSYSDATGNVYQANAADCGKAAGVDQTFLTTANGYCGYKYTTATDLIPRSSEASGMLQLTKTLDANNTLKLQYYATQSKVTTWGGAYSYDFLMDPTINAAYFPSGGTQYYNLGPDTSLTNGDVNVYWTDPGNNRYQGDKSTEQHFLAALTGSHADWDYNASFNYSQNVSSVFLAGGYPDTDLLNVSRGTTNADGTPDGVMVLNPLINPFGAQTAAGQALINSAYRSGNIDTAKLRMVDINASASHSAGDWFHAGDATLALGFDLRHEQIQSSTTALATELAPETGYFPSSVTGKRNLEAVYAELNVPVTKHLEFTLADRDDHYSDFGNTNNAKLSARYQPAKFVTFRAAVSTGFRAPTLVNLYSPQVLGAGSPFGSTIAGQLGVPAVGQGYVVSGGNPTLKPEKSNNYDLGIVLAPATDLGVTLDFYRVTINNQITTLTGSTIYKNYASLGNFYHLNNKGTLSLYGDGSCDAGFGAATCGYISRQAQNTGGVTTNGVDLSVNYTLNTSFGRFRTGLEGTWVSQYKLQAYNGAAWQNVRGNYSGGYEPVLAWQDTLTLDWTKDVWGAGLSNHYSSGYADENGGRANGAWMWNGYATWQATKQVKLLMGVRNLFDTRPSFSNQSDNWQEGYNPVIADPTGRAIYGKVTIDF